MRLCRPTDILGCGRIQNFPKESRGAHQLIGTPNTKSLAEHATSSNSAKRLLSQLSCISHGVSRGILA